MWYTGTSEYNENITCSSALTLTSPVSHSVEVGPLGQGLDFTDQDGQVVPPSVSIVPGPTEGSARPAVLYVRRAPADDEIAPVSITFAVYVADATQKRVQLSSEPAPSQATVSPEARGAAFWRHFFDTAFDPGPLQTIFSAWGAVFLLIKAFEEARNRRIEAERQAEERKEKEKEALRQLRQKISALQDEPSVDKAFRAYLSLKEELSEPKDLLGEHLANIRLELKSAFRAEWFPALRRDVARYLARDAQEASRRFKANREEWEKAKGKQSADMVEEFLACFVPPASGQRADRSFGSESLRKMVDGLRTVGLEAAEPVVNWLEQAYPEPALSQNKQTVRVELFGGGVAGRYLLGRWAERNPKVKEWLQEWQTDRWRQFYAEQGPGMLWPQKRGEAERVRKGWANVGWTANPFGPEKAEYDRGLFENSLFWERADIWDDVIAPQPSVIGVGPGGGRSALIWMVRHRCGLIGTPLATVFPVFVPLAALASGEEVLKSIAGRALDALCCALAADPYNFLGLDPAAQFRLAEFMLDVSGNMPALLAKLRQFGLSTDEPDGDLLVETLKEAVGSGEARPGHRVQRLPPLALSGTQQTFLLIDFLSDDVTQVEQLLELLFDRWLPDLSTCQIVPKVFINKLPSRVPVTPILVDWSEKNLLDLLRHRVRCVRPTPLPAEGNALEDLGLDDQAVEKLVKAANGTPARLVAMGNRLLAVHGDKNGISDSDLAEVLRIFQQD